LEKRGSHFLVSDGIIIALLTAIGYAVGYYFEVGYRSYFKIPEDFIDLSVASIVKAVGVTFLAILFLVGLSNSLIQIYNSMDIKDEAIKDEVDHFLWVAGGLLLINLFLGISSTVVITFFSFLAIYIFISFIVPIFRFKSFPTYAEKLAASAKKRREEAPADGILNVTIRKLGRRRFQILIICLFVIAAVPNVKLLGVKQARDQKVFLVIFEQENRVIIGTYKDYVITAKINLVKREVEPDYTLVKNEEVRAILVQTGKLKVVEPKSVTDVTYND
jgi:hypothetical protein